MSTEATHVVLYQKPGPQLQDYADLEYRRMLQEYPTIEGRLRVGEGLWQASGESGGMLNHPAFTFRDTFSSAATNTLVIGLDSLSDVLHALDETLQAAQKNATLEADLFTSSQDEQTLLLPYAKKPAPSATDSQL